MAWFSRLMIWLLAVSWAALASAQDSEKRIALVIGNAAYQVGALNTAANDAGLIAQTLEAAGFDVVGARDLDQDSLRRAFRDFLDKAQASGPNTVAFVYLSGYGLQLEGENYFVPVDARIARDADVASQTIRISDYTRPLATLGLRTTIIVLDAARPHPYGASGTQLAGGLALLEPEPGMLIAYNAAPDTVAPDGPGPYGPYAQALAEMMREGGVPLAEVFERVRLRVNELTRGAEVPWHASKVQEPYVFFERGPDAPPPPISFEEKTAFRARPIRDLDSQDAYLAALERDTIEGYIDFLAVYPDDPMAGRVRAIVAARREAITWRRTRAIDTPEAYWTYLHRYPRGRHAWEARRRLAFLAAVLEPPPSFAVIDYEVPPPPPEEYVYVERRVLVFDDPVFAFAPPPSPPLIFLVPRSPEFVVLLAPPPPPVALFVLPIPIYRPVPVWVRPPVYVAPPPANNIIFNNIHNTVVINNTTNVVTITNRSGQTTTVSPPPSTPAAPGSTHPASAAIGPALPPSVAQKAGQTPPEPQPGVPGQTQTPQPGHAQPTQPLPGMRGVPLPIVPPLKGQTPPTAKVTPPTSTPLPEQSLPKQSGQPQQQGQPPIKGKLPEPGKGGPLPGAPMPGQPTRKPPGQSFQQQGQGQPPPKGQLPPPTSGPSPMPPPAPSQRQFEQEQQRQRQLDQQRQQQEQQRQRQLEQQRQQQLEQQRQRQIEQQRQLQEQQRQRQLEQQRQQQLEQQRQRQIEQQRQQIEQQRQQQIQRQQEQQRQRQLEQQRQQQLEQQRQRQIEQQEQQRQRQIEQQRQQQIQQQRQQPQPQPQRKQPNCGAPGQPPCPKP